MASNDYLNKSQGTERQSQQYSELSIKATAFGGLNLSANPLNIPYEDSPLMRNVVTDLSGSIVKRKGTQVLYRESTQEYQAITLMPVSTALAYNLLCVKNGRNLEVFEINNNKAVKVITKANVWNALVQNKKTSWLLTSESTPRLLCMTGVNKPVQFSFNENQSSYSSGNNVSFQSARLQASTAANTIVWVNRTRYTGTAPTFSFNNDTLTLTFAAGVLAVGDTVDITTITWQWWAESFHWLGDRFFATQTRFNATTTDQVVKVPSNLMTNIEPAETKVRTWGMITASSGDITGFTNVNDYKVNNNPVSATEWTYSDGSRYVSGNNNVTNPTPFFIVFGTTTGTTPTTVYFSRRRSIPFESSNYVQPSSIDVYIDDILQAQTTAAIGNRPTYGSYSLSDKSGALVTNTTTLAKYIEFSNNKLGVAQQSTIIISNKNTKHIGSAAVSTQYSDSAQDGAYVPMFGFGLYADYLNGSYPSTVSLYQDRLVLGGFSHRPALVLFSNISDSVTPGNFYNFYQATDDPLALLPTAPFDIELPKRGSDDRIVALVEWQRSLFVLTRRASYRVSPNGTTALSLTSIAVTFLSSTGCVNENCVVQTENSVQYLSDNGLYDLLPRVEDSEYIANEKSIKIRKNFGLTNDPIYEDLAWLSYDPIEKYIYVGYPARGNVETSVYLYVYDTSRNSWTEFETPGYFRLFDAKAMTDRLLGSIFVGACTTEQKATAPNRGVATNLTLIKFSNKQRYVDYYEATTKQTNGNESYYVPPIPTISLTIASEWEQAFNTTYETILQTSAFKYLPLKDVSDFTGTLTSGTSTVALTYGTDYIKTGDDTLYLIKRGKAGDRYTFVWQPPNAYKNSQNYTHMCVWVNGISYTSFSIAGTPGNITFPSTLTNGNKLEWGMVYCAYYESPMFFLDQLSTYKRAKHLYAFFDNEMGLDTYKNIDVNTAVSQQPEQIVNRYKQDVNANISVMYNTERGGFVSADTYGSRSVVWDDTPLDFDTSADQAFRYSVFKEPLQGIGYAYQLAVWSTDDATFKLCGFQFDIQQKGKRYTSRF